MKNRIGHYTFRIAAYVLGALAAWVSSEDFIGTEFSGGRITGPTLDASVIGAFVLILALVASFIWPRLGAVGSLLACAMCVPMQVYLTFPSVFVRLTQGAGVWADPPRDVFT